jgi:hypothetical protein
LRNRTPDEPGRKALERFDDKAKEIAAKICSPPPGGELGAKGRNFRESVG